jgi:hypothetical protein
MTEVPPPPPGWYPDPELPSTVRYWSGTGWTEHRSAAPAAAPPQSSSGSGCLTAFLVVLGIIAAIVVGAVVVGAVSRGGGAAQREVEYRFSGTASGGSITYSTPDGQEQQDISLPGSITFTTSSGYGSWVSLIQNMGETGSVTCSILVDGEVVSTNTSSAAFGIASCDATTGGF